MRIKELSLVFAIIVFVMMVCIGPASAARTIPASNETSTLVVQISASSVGDLTSHTDVVFQQGNEDLNNNPPLNPAGEGVSTIGYFEDTMATGGSIEYDQSIRLDTGNRVAPQNNLETTRIIDYSNEGDGEAGGRMVSSEAVLVDVMATASNQTDGCCPWGSASDEVLPATNDRVIAGSEMDLTEGSVASQSSARTVAASVDEPVELTYSVDVQASNQTQDDYAQGTATAYVDAIIQEGSGEGTNQTTDMSYEQEITVDGLVDLAMSVNYESA